MKSHISIIVIVTLSVLVCLLLAFLIKNKLDEKQNSEYISEASGSKIMKVESSDEITYVIEDYDKDLTYSWSFNKDEEYQNSLKDGMNLDLDLKLDVLTDEYNKIIDEKVSNEDKLIISFNHHGELPTKATIRLQVKDRFKDGDKLYLYYYNPEEDIIEYIDKGIKVKDGYVEFDIEHCSDYFLTASVVQEAVNNPKNINLVIVGMIVVVIVLVGVTLFQSKK